MYESDVRIIPDCEIVRHAEVYGLDNSIRASRFPMAVDTEKCPTFCSDNTHSLATAQPGSGHDNFLNGIIVQFDLTLSVKAWTDRTER